MEMGFGMNLIEECGCSLTEIKDSRYLYFYLAS